MICYKLLRGCSRNWQGFGCCGLCWCCQQSPQHVIYSLDWCLLGHKGLCPYRLMIRACWARSVRQQNIYFNQNVLCTLMALLNGEKACYTISSKVFLSYPTVVMAHQMRFQTLLRRRRWWGCNWREKEVRELWTLALVIVGYVCFACLLTGQFYSPTSMVFELMPFRRLPWWSEFLHHFITLLDGHTTISPMLVE